MTVWGGAGAARVGTTVVAAFLASLVECVEALTVVLAVGTVRGWPSALAGCGAALVTLAVLVAALGPALTRVPLGVVQLVVGTMILLFGMRWLRKAILRAAGLIALHDETVAFAKNAAAMRGVGGMGARMDRVAFAAAFNITMMEGTEVVFLVIALGAGGLLGAASVGAGLAAVTVAGLGLALHRPLARVPENAMKFAVGVLLSGFGTFWVGEGAGATWVGGEWAIVGLMAAWLGIALGMVGACRARARIGAVA